MSEIFRMTLSGITSSLIKTICKILTVQHGILSGGGALGADTDLWDNANTSNGDQQL